MSDEHAGLGLHDALAFAESLAQYELLGPRAAKDCAFCQTSARKQKSPMHQSAPNRSAYGKENDNWKEGGSTYSLSQA